MFSACGAINREMKWKERRGARRPGRELKIKKKIPETPFPVLRIFRANCDCGHVYTNTHTHIYTPISYREYSRVQKAHTNLDEDFRRG